ncbi:MULTISPECIES: retroviral-like aspartic protease family protein [unclassified Microcoleus]|uniref:retroviral-like aspartic protease family protein n=1 Tax=unclassified Microcoleus TaxID=2642155 RepID=UPI002FD08935
MLVTDNTSMGKIITALTVTNRIDQANVERGIIPAEQVRSVTLDNVLVDTGATTLCLPPQIIAQLGLSLLKEVDVETANGIGKARIFQDAKISLVGREGTFECLELPGGMNPLLGVIPLEALGIELDLKNQRLIILPISPTQTYLTIL